jgi:hypothetical protein
LSDFGLCKHTVRLFSYRLIGNQTENWFRPQNWKPQ